MRIRKAIAGLDAIIYGMIAERRAGKPMPAICSRCFY
jgi:hypothetical protein